MSDETPTERFDAATRPLPSADGVASDSASAPAAGADADEKQKRGMLIALLAIAAAILVALVVLIVVVLGNSGSDDAGPAPEFTTTEAPTPTPTETASSEPSQEPTVEPSAEPSASASAPPPPPQSPSFATFSGPNQANCPDTSSSVEVTWSWSSSNAVNAWFGIGTQDAKAEPFESVPTTATYTFNYQCSEASQIYTVTLEDSSGRLTHKTVTVTRG